MDLQYVAQIILDCALVALNDADAPPCKSFLSPSPNPVWDDCCACGRGREGQLWVSTLGAEPILPFRGAPCGRQFRVTFQVGLTRCAHSMGENGEVPTAAQINEDATKMFRDRKALFAALDCCVVDTLDLDMTQYTIGPWEVEPQQGGCQAQLVNFLVDLTLCSDC